MEKRSEKQSAHDGITRLEMSDMVLDLAWAQELDAELAPELGSVSD